MGIFNLITSSIFGCYWVLDAQYVFAVDPYKIWQIIILLFSLHCSVLHDKPSVPMLQWYTYRIQYSNTLSCWGVLLWAYFYHTFIFYVLTVDWRSAHTHTPSPPKVSSMNTYSTLWYVPFHIFNHFFACYTILIFQIHSTRGFKPILGFKPEILIPWLDTMLENQCKKMTSCSWIKPQWNPSHTIIFLWDFSIL